MNTLVQSHDIPQPFGRWVQLLAGSRPVSQGPFDADVDALPRWQRSRLARAIRGGFQRWILGGVVDLVAPVRVTGAEYLEGLRGPAIFAVNHASHLDAPALLRALPSRLRERLVPTTAADYWFRNPILGAVVRLLLNGFPFHRCGSARATLAQAQALLTAGWCLLIFPEGTRSLTGEMAPFKRGVGLLAARAGHVPVVPVHVGGAYDVLPKGSSVPRPGPMTVAFGTPLRFPPGTGSREATAQIEVAVHNLAA
jgi:1-acyl-sn-glycerol-3-phosphate acyltransferase